MNWIKLKDTQPLTQGYYLTYNPTLKGNEPTKFVVDVWDVRYKCFTISSKESPRL